MIDLRALRDDPEAFRRSQRARGADPAVVDEVLAADERRRAAVTAADALRAESNTASRAIQGASPDQRPAMIGRAKELKESVRAAEADESAADAALRDAAYGLANLVEEGTPEGGEADSVVIETVGEVPHYDFEVRDHVDIGQRLAAFDLERGAKVSGARFYFLTGVGALLEFALVNFAMQRATAAGFVPVIAPALVRPEAMEGTGFLGAHAAEVYRVDSDDLYLVGTSEVPLAAMHGDEILDADLLPRRYAGFSSCFRREAGSYGQDTRGLIRVHWFDKVEMFSYCPVEDSQAE
ncbi:MAG TPA: aminoacyl--tRNA ligase-related protein, partial [Mycobacteriales bacterium]|nr:aminoacyl--tRNA ligase-related protein [Mycobacteriales bacterium]